MTPKARSRRRTYGGSGRLQATRALITGGGSGIGRAVAIAFAREGASVCITYVPQEEPDATETISWVVRSGVDGFKVHGDLTETAMCARVIEESVEHLGGLDILVNNAGFHFTRAPKVASAGWRRPPCGTRAGPVTPKTPANHLPTSRGAESQGLSAHHHAAQQSRFHHRMWVFPLRLHHGHGARCAETKPNAAQLIVVPTHARREG